MTSPYEFVPCVQFPTLEVVKTRTGQFFIKATSAVMLITGQSEANAKVVMNRFIKNHYPDNSGFPSIEVVSQSDHIGQYKTASGRNSYAFSLVGLEYLCTHLPGAAAFANRAQFLALIEDFKRSLPHKRPHASSGEGAPNPKRAATEQGDGGEAGLNSVAVVKKISGEVAKLPAAFTAAVAPFQKAVLSGQKKASWENMKIRDGVSKVEQKATKIEKGVNGEMAAMRTKLLKYERSVAILNETVREKEMMIEHLNADQRQADKEYREDILRFRELIKTDIHELKAQVTQNRTDFAQFQNEVKSGMAEIQATLKSLFDLLLPA